jgi:fibronectin-binding autotransporter adhesin
MFIGLGISFLRATASVVAVTIIDWSATAATSAWATGANWVGGVAPSNDTISHTAQFNQASYLTGPDAGTTSVEGIVIGAASAPLTIAGTALTVGADGVVNNSANAVTISSPLAGSMAVTQNGANTLTLSGAGTYTGGVRVNAGTVVVNVGSALGTTTGTTLGAASGSADATLQINSGLTANNGITSASGSSGVRTITKNSGAGTSTMSGGLTATGSLTFDVKGGIISRTSGAITGSATITVSNSAMGTQANEYLNLAVANAGYTGLIIITSNGTVRSTGGVSNASSVQINSGGLLQITPVTTTLTGLNDNAGAGGTINVTSTNRQLNLTGSGTYSFNGIYIGAGCLFNKTGSGTQTLGGVSTNTGANTVSGGTLYLTNGARPGTGTVTLSSTAKLGCILTGGVASTATIGNLTMSGTSCKLEFQSTASAMSKFTVTGTTVLTAGTIDFPAGITTNGTYDIIVSTGAMSGTNPTVGTNGTGKTLVIQRTGNTLQVVVS